MRTSVSLGWLAVLFSIAVMETCIGAEPQPVRTFDSGTNTGTGSFLPDGQTVLVGGRLWDVQTEALLHEFEGSGRNAISTDGRLAVMETGTHSVTLWDLGTREAIRSFDCPSESTSGLTLSPDGLHLAICGAENAELPVVLLYRLEDGTLIRRIENPSAGELAFSTDGAVLAACGFRDVTLWDVDSGLSTKVLEIDDCQVRSAAFSPDDARLAAVSACTKCIYVWDVASGQRLYEWPGAGTDIEFSPDGRFLLVGGFRPYPLEPHQPSRILSLAKGTELGSLPYSGDSVDWSPDGKQVLLTSSGVSTLWNVEDFLKQIPATHYVWLESPNPTPPYDTWETAAHVIQDAVDVAPAGSTVLVTNGVYSVGQREISILDTNRQPPDVVIGWGRVVVTNAISLESVNGPELTVIQGAKLDPVTGVGTAITCIYIGNGAALTGFTLTNGWGGVLCEAAEVVSNCVITGNSGWSGAGGGTLYNCTLRGNSAQYGGGASGSTLYNCTLVDNRAGKAMEHGGGGGVYNSTLFNCTLTGNYTVYCRGGASLRSTLINCTVTGNSAIGDGGGAHGSTLINCTVTGNSATGMGGGALQSTLYNCILYYNTAPIGANYFTGVIEDSTYLEYSCTTPLPITGIGNIAEPPLFIDMAAGDFRLREDSPCIDAGINLIGATMTVTNANPNGFPETFVVAYTHTPTDILGNTRFIDGNGDGVVAWDIGAYEFNSFPPPKFSVSPELTSNGWKFTITGAPNKWVGLQRTSDFSGWEDVQSPVFVGSDGKSRNH
jgi:WD40 repeat protein